MANEPGMFDKARGYVIRGHEVAMAIAIFCLAVYSSVITLGLAMTITNSSGVRQQSAYNLGYDVGVFCHEDMTKCSVVCRNNFENEITITDCLRGVVNGYNSKDEQALWEETVRQAGE